MKTVCNRCNVCDSNAYMICPPLADPEQQIKRGTFLVSCLHIEYKLELLLWTLQISRISKFIHMKTARLVLTLFLPSHFYVIYYICFVPHKSNRKYQVDACFGYLHVNEIFGILFENVCMNSTHSMPFVAIVCNCLAVVFLLWVLNEREVISMKISFLCYCVLLLLLLLFVFGLYGSGMKINICDGFSSLFIKRFFSI